MEPTAPARGGARPDARTGGTLVLKKGAGRDVDFHANPTRRRSADSGPTLSRPKKRKCLFCGKPMLFVSAPLILVIAFVIRGQQSSTPGATAAAAGYMISLDARTLGSEVAITITVRPPNRLLRLFLRAKPAPAGTPVNAALYAPLLTDSPELLFGATPEAGQDVATLSTRIKARGGEARQVGTPVSAQVSISGQTVSLATRVRAGT